MNSFQKLWRHIRQGTLIERIQKNKEIEKYKKWSKFQSGNTDFLIKEIDGGKIKLYKNSYLSELIFFDRLEKDEMIFVKKFLKKGDVFIDAGANIGLYSIMISKLIGNTGKIIAIEPTQKTYEKLLENIKINIFKNIFPQNIALSDKETKLQLNVSVDGFDAWNSLGKPSAGKEIRQEEVATKTLDKLAEEMGVKNQITFIKIDVEGWEFPVLNGSTKTLSAEKSPVLMIEFCDQNANNAGYSCRQLYNFITSKGYQLYSYNADKNELMREEEKSDYLNFNFIATKDLNYVLNRIK